MIKRIATLSAATLLLVACNQDKVEASTESPQVAAAEQAAAEYTSNPQIISYGVGYNIGTQVSSDPNFPADVDAIVAGLRDAIAGTDPKVDPDKVSAAVQAFQEELAAEQAKVAEAAKAEADKFLADTAAKEGYHKTESGLLYRVIKSGAEGKKPGPDDTVKTHYHGTLVDGTVFDSSVERGEPVEFPVSGVIPGWTEALQMMNVGDKWELVIPPDLAYGANPPPSIPANSVLIFEVELLDIKEPKS
ncbi:FKBP-type peptidyl-prolyl cis-trans isomerase [Gynuella sp.]|uniref:FKBP-type peptidyl-prolyl cis-trans isomerase n=1 Tax=Gynuella sp. TaxID=2969146 RepID=UPI003D110743